MYGYNWSQRFEYQSLDYQSQAIQAAQVHLHLMILIMHVNVVAVVFDVQLVIDSLMSELHAMLAVTDPLSMLLMMYHQIIMMLHVLQLQQLQPLHVMHLVSYCHYHCYLIWMVASLPVMATEMMNSMIMNRFAIDDLQYSLIVIASLIAPIVDEIYTNKRCRL